MALFKKKDKEPKPPKPKKEKKAKKPKESEESAEPKEKGEKKPLGKKLILIIVIVLLLAAAGVAAFLFLGKGKGGGEPEEPPAESEIEEAAEPEETAPPEPEETMTVKETVDYLSSLTPAILGLPGQSMSEYRLYCDGSNAKVDGLLCTEVTVYKIGNAGTNDIAGVYLVSRAVPRRVYKLDKLAKEVTAIDLP